MIVGTGIFCFFQIKRVNSRKLQLIPEQVPQVNIFHSVLYALLIMNRYLVLGVMFGCWCVNLLKDVRQSKITSANQHLKNVNFPGKKPVIEVEVPKWQIWGIRVHVHHHTLY